MVQEKVQLALERLKADDKDEVQQGIRDLVFYGQDALPHLLDAVRYDKVHELILAEVFAKMGEIACDPLLDLLGEDNNEYQRKAAFHLAHIGNDKAVMGLILTLSDDSDLVRAEVTKALSTIQDIRAINPLLKMLEDTSPRVRAQVAETLGAYEYEPRLEQAITKLLDDPKPEVRIGALKGLAHWKRENITDLFRRMENDPVADVRQIAVAAHLFQRGDRLAFKRLEDNRDKDTDVITQALSDVYADGEITESDRDVIMHSNPRVRARLLEELSLRGQQNALTLLLPSLNDINPAVRNSAKDALVRLGAPALPLMINALKDDSKYRRAGLAEVFGKIGGEAVIQPLLELLEDQEEMVSTSAMNALITLDNASSYPLLADKLDRLNETQKQIMTQFLIEKGYEFPEQKSILGKFKKWLK
ncbi:hypothetical protein MASR2M15_06230 [Anaerolineales bacterium]